MLAPPSPAIVGARGRPEHEGWSMAETEQGRMVRVPEAHGRSGLDGYFGITDRGSTVRTEIAAGVTTWLTMAYILFVNPAILGAVKDSQGVSLTFPEVLTVTALVAGVMTLAMGVYGRSPFAIAAGLGLNAFVAFSLVGTLGLTWPQAMGVIVAEGILITIFVLTGLRELILNAIPMDLKRAIGIGIGLFIAFIGLVNAGVVMQAKLGPVPPVTIVADFRSWSWSTRWPRWRAVPPRLRRTPPTSRVLRVSRREAARGSPRSSWASCSCCACSSRRSRASSLRWRRRRSS